jgi:TRAP-type C4-dicarboxylate transport system permease small subunit
VPPPPATRAGAGAAVAAVARWWALAGGVLTLGLAAMTAVSALLNLATGRPLPFDYELVKHLVAIAIFMFLPYCQVVGANVTVDIFTERMREGSKQAMAAFSALFAIGFSALLLVQMTGGFASYLRYQEVTPVLGLPLWTAFPPILVSLALLFLAACVTFGESWQGWRSRR